MRGYLFIGLAACGFTPSHASGDGGGPLDVDADVDAATLPIDAVLGDAPPLCESWHPVHFMPCLLGSPMPGLTLTMTASPYKYDTTTDGGVLTDKDGTVVVTSPLTVQQSDNSYIAVLSVASFTVGASTLVNVVGPKPLLVASWGMLDVMGEIDVGSHTTETDPTAHIQQTTTLGAGAQSATCSSTAPTLATPGQIAVMTGGSGGGGGGAFHGNGGNGAVGDMNCTMGETCPRAGGVGGTGGNMPAVLRAGCAGADSGAAGPGALTPATATTSSKGGLGGGAIELAAMGDIHIAGTLRAGGAAGAGAPQGAAAGGGGGGAGGYIGLDSHNMVMTGGTIAANGAGGGGSGPFADHGNVGQDGQASQTAANGGAAHGSPCGLPGANGSTTGNGAGATSNDTCGGGGGGGGAGWVIAYTMNHTGGGVISPSITVVAN
ncbi:MAG TPA: hypothetical protein VF403_00880 [Kofleriaceae bacterium]